MTITSVAWKGFPLSVQNRFHLGFSLYESPQTARYLIIDCFCNSQCSKLKILSLSLQPLQSKFPIWHCLNRLPSLLENLTGIRVRKAEVQKQNKQNEPLFTSETKRTISNTSSGSQSFEFPFLVLTGGSSLGRKAACPPWGWIWLPNVKRKLWNQANL